MRGFCRRSALPKPGASLVSVVGLACVACAAAAASAAASPAAPAAVEKHALVFGEHIIALDQIGFGGSDKSLLDYRAETLVDFLDEFMSTLHVARATIVGNSLGGWVAALLAIRHPQRVQRLVLVDAAGLSALTASLGPRRLEALRLATVDDLRTLAPLTFADRRYYRPDDVLRKAFADRVAAHDGYTVSRLVDSIERGEDMLDGRLREITQSTLIIWGRQDGLIPLRFGERLRRGIRGAKLVVIDRCGHEPQVECPDAFESALEAFLAR